LKNKKVKKAIWFYAVVLFTSAFILLLFTYFNQDQFDKNLNEYISKLSEEEKKKISIQTNLFSVTEENNNLKNEVNSLKKELEEIKNSKKVVDSEKTELNKDFLKLKEAYEHLINAENLYLKGNIVESAEILVKKCDKSVLGFNALESYNSLLEKTLFKASRELYIQGYEYYKNKQYDMAIDKFKQSLEFEKNSYLSDDCYYFISYSYYWLNDIENAKNNIQTLLDNYPDSSYKNDSLLLMQKLG
jgi:TolA-binding protein